MTDAGISESRHERVSALLPWYVNRTLEEPERALVEAHLSGCPNCREDAMLLIEMQAAVRDEAAVPILGKPDSKRLLEAIDGRRPPGAPATQRPWALAASVAAVFIVVALYFALPSKDEPTVYDTVTRDAEAGPFYYVIELVFEPGMSGEAQRGLLEKIGATDVVREAPDRYRAVMTLQDSSLAALDQRVAELEALQEVADVQPVALQLPVESER